LVLNEQGEALRAELAALPNDALELLLLRFVDELPYADIAQVLELTEAAVRQRVSRVIRELRATWAARWEERELVR
jgi:RNA polymerase sigma-70 factor (ECF subfamily)